MLPGLVRTMRPHQWVKNLFVLAPLLLLAVVVSCFQMLLPEKEFAA